MAIHCPMCTVKVPFVDVNELKVHLATHHFHVSPYACEVCCVGSKWPTEYALKGHYALAHGINDVKIKFQYTEAETKAKCRMEEVIARALLPLPATVGIKPLVVYEGPETIGVEHHTRTWAEIKAEEQEREKENVAARRSKGRSALGSGKKSGPVSSSVTTRRQRAMQASTSNVRERQRAPRKRAKSAEGEQRSGAESKGFAWRTLNVNLAALSKKATAQSDFSLGDI